MIRKAMVVWLAMGLLLIHSPAWAQIRFMETYVSDDCSLRFDYPGNWVSEGAGSQAWLANKPDVLKNKSVQLAMGEVLVSVRGVTLDELNGKLQSMGGISFLVLSDLLVLDATSDVEIVQSPAPIFAEFGSEAIHLVSSQDGIETITIIVRFDAGRIVIVAGSMLPDERSVYQPLINGVAQSARLTMPSLNAYLATNAQAPESGDKIRQWARCATATSEYAPFNWSAMQATGAPDTDTCDDISTAWASQSSTGIDALTLEFAHAVVPSQINIYQTYNPGSITKVEVVITDGDTHLTLPDSADPPENTPCPGVFTININERMPPVHAVIIHLNQTIGGSWNEIDAVELVGQVP